MRFSTWLWEQLDEGDAIGRFAILCWKDVNNGCAHATFDASDWLKHIRKYHSEREDVLVPLLIGAFYRYRIYLGVE